MLDLHCLPFDPAADKKRRRDMPDFARASLDINWADNNGVGLGRVSSRRRCSEQTNGCWSYIVLAAYGALRSITRIGGETEQ